MLTPSDPGCLVDDVRFAEGATRATQKPEVDAFLVKPMLAIGEASTPVPVLEVLDADGALLPTRWQPLLHLLSWQRLYLGGRQALGLVTADTQRARLGTWSFPQEGHPPPALERTLGLDGSQIRFGSSNPQLELEGTAQVNRVDGDPNVAQHLAEDDEGGMRTSGQAAWRIPERLRQPRRPHDRPDRKRWQ